MFLAVVLSAIFAWFGPVGYYYYTQVQGMALPYDGVRIAFSILLLVTLSSVAVGQHPPQSSLDR